MNKAQLFLEKYKSGLFDWLVFSISFSLGFIFPSSDQIFSSPLFSFMMITALVLYTAGAWLKHFPLYKRMDSIDKPLTLFISLMVIHWFLIAAAVIFSAPAFRQIFGMPPATREGPDNLVITISCIAAIIITWLVFRSDAWSGSRSYSHLYLFRRELAGDLCLVVGVSIFSFIIWEKAILTKLFNAPILNFSDFVGAIVGLALTYILFYLPLRFLYLVEDKFSGKTWRRLGLIWMVFILKNFIEMW